MAIFESQKARKHYLTSDGKGIMPYEIIVDMESFFVRSENDFWEKSEFFSELKQSAVNDEEYENSKYLYQTLKWEIWEI